MVTLIMYNKIDWKIYNLFAEKRLSRLHLNYVITYIFSCCSYVHHLQSDSHRRHEHGRVVVELVGVQVADDGVHVVRTDRGRGGAAAL